MLKFPHVQAKNGTIRLPQIERSGGAGTPRITTPKGLASMRSQSTPIACAIQLSGRNSRWTLIDFDDVERVSCHTWWADPSGRPYTTIKRRTVLLNRFVLNAQSGVEVDHVNGDVLDNRRGNLRLATRSENEANKGIQANNTSGFKGVSFNISAGCFEAYIHVNKRKRRLGFFDSAEDAARAYDDAALELFGEFARTNAMMGRFS